MFAYNGLKDDWFQPLLVDLTLDYIKNYYKIGPYGRLSDNYYAGFDTKLDSSISKWEMELLKEWIKDRMGIGNNLNFK